MDFFGIVDGCTVEEGDPGALCLCGLIEGLGEVCRVVQYWIVVVRWYL